MLPLSVEKTLAVCFFEVTNSNPNGDPDAENSPRTDPETLHGLITDVCLKRKLRDYVALEKGGDIIYIKARGVLASEQEKAYKALNLQPGKSSNEQARQWMCKNYWDVRTFGALMATGSSKESADTEETTKKYKAGKNSRFDCGVVRGPVQISFGLSLDPVLVLDHSITRVALTNSSDGAGSTENEDGSLTANSGQMGRKQMVAYGLYKFTVSVNPFLASEVGFSADDLKLLLHSLTQMFNNDASAARSQVSMRKVYVFTHDSPLGSAPTHQLLDSLVIKKKVEVAFPRQFSDYSITLKPTPKGVKLVELVDGISTSIPENVKVEAEMVG
jgi:CRISPR-associated protein Csd2